MITREGGTEDELRAVSSRQCLLLVGTRQKKKKKCNARCTFTRAAHPGMPWKSIRDTSAPSEPPEGASRSKLERCSLCFTLSFSCKEGKLRANLSANQWVECADYTRTDHHYLFIYFW